MKAGFLCAFLLFQVIGHSQAISPEAFAGIGLGHLFRFEDEPLGNGPNIAAGFRLRLSPALGLEFEVNRTLGLSPSPAQCAIVGVVCQGAGRDGISSAMLATANLIYYFSRARVQPYVTGGAGALFSTSFSSITFVSGSTATIVEQSRRETGFAWNAGGGLRIQLGRGISLRPELRFYDSTALSRVNVSLVRPSVAVGYEW